MPADRADYRDRRRQWAEERRAHRKDAPPGCTCIDCLGVDGFHRMMVARAKAEAERMGPPPF